MTTQGPESFGQNIEKEQLGPRQSPEEINESIGQEKEKNYGLSFEVLDFIESAPENSPNPDQSMAEMMESLKSVPGGEILAFIENTDYRQFKIPDDDGLLASAAKTSDPQERAKLIGLT